MYISKVHLLGAGSIIGSLGLIGLRFGCGIRIGCCRGGLIRRVFFIFYFYFIFIDLVDFVETRRVKYSKK